MFLLFSTLPLYAQSDTNAAPMLAPAYGELPLTFWEQHQAAILVAGFAFLGFALLSLTLWLRPQTEVILLPEVVARQALAKLQGRPEDGKLLSEISQILRRYIATVLKFPSAEMTTTECYAALSTNPAIGSELARAIASFLRECDNRKFSPAPSAAPFGGTDRALELIKLTERRLWNVSQSRISISPPPIPLKQPPPMVPAATPPGNQRVP